MAQFFEHTAEQKAAMEQWISHRPPIVQELARRFPINHLFRNRHTGQICYPLAYSEDGTMRVHVCAVHNPHLLMMFDLEVFGIKPEDLEECEDDGS